MFVFLCYNFLLVILLSPQFKAWGWSHFSPHILLFLDLFDIYDYWLILIGNIHKRSMLQMRQNHAFLWSVFHDQFARSNYSRYIKSGLNILKMNTRRKRIFTLLLLFLFFGDLARLLFEFFCFYRLEVLCKLFRPIRD